MDLSEVTFQTDSDPMVATFRWLADVPQSGSVLWQVTLQSNDGETTRFLGYKIVDGRYSAQFVFDLGGPWQANLPRDADLQPHSLTARFNPMALNDIGPEWTWTAIVNVDGEDTARFQP